MKRRCRKGPRASRWDGFWHTLALSLGGDYDAEMAAKKATKKSSTPDTAPPSTGKPGDGDSEEEFWQRVSAAMAAAGESGPDGETSEEFWQRASAAFASSAKQAADPTVYMNEKTASVFLFRDMQLFSETIGRRFSKELALTELPTEQQKLDNIFPLDGLPMLAAMLVASAMESHDEDVSTYLVLMLEENARERLSARLTRRR